MIATNATNEQMRTPQQWVQLYESCGLHGTHSTAPGLVALPLTGQVTAVNTPGALGDRILGLLPSESMYAPVLARAKPARYTFLTDHDRHAEPEIVARLERYGVDVGPHRAAVHLPTGFRPRGRTELYWVRSPRQGDPLPTLTGLLALMTRHLLAAA